MKTEDYLAALDSKLNDIAGIVTASAIQREVDTNSGIGSLKGYIAFVDGSRFEFMEQLPTERAKFRLHHMDSSNSLIARWDGAPSPRIEHVSISQAHSAARRAARGNDCLAGTG